MNRTQRPRIRVARAVAALAFAGLLLSARDARAAWQRFGNPVCVATGAQHDPIGILPWVVWTDERSGIPQAYVGDVDPSTGLPVSIAANGIPVAPSATPQLDVTAIDHLYSQQPWIAWSEDRGTGSGSDIYLMRFAKGVPAPGWPAGGLLVCGAPGEQRHPRLLWSYRYNNNFPLSIVLLVFVTWEDARDGVPVLEATAVDEDAATSPGWTAGGTQVSIGAGPVRNVALVSRGQGAVAVSEQSGGVFAQAMSLDGVVPADASWPVGGRRLSDASVPASHAAVGRIYDAVLVAWEELRNGRTEIRAQGWGDSTSVLFGPEAIVVVSDPVAHPSAPQAWAGADPSTMIVGWTDSRADGGDLYQSVVDLPEEGGSFHAQPGAGTPRIVVPGKQSGLTAFSRLVWEDARSGVPQLYTRYLDDQDPRGEPVAATGASETQLSGSIWTGVELALWLPRPPVVFWTDARNPATGLDIYAQALGPRGPGTIWVPPSPPALALSNAYPTPSRSWAIFTLGLPEPTAIELVVTDVAGRAVRVLARRELPAGRSFFTWDGHDDDGVRAAPGIYWLRARIGSRTLGRRIVLLAD